MPSPSTGAIRLRRPHHRIPSPNELSLHSMTRKFGAFGLTLLLFSSVSLPAQKKATGKAVRFQGAPQYTQQELLAAAGLKPDQRLAPAEIKAHGKLLNDTGVFKEVRFSSDAKTIT